MSTRFAKQLIYATFYVVVLVLVVWGGFAIFGRSAASCFDGKQNQGEQGIDCGGPCATVCTSGTSVQPVSVLSVSEFVPSAGHATFLAKLANTNAQLAAPYFAFSFNLVDASGAALESFPGASFLYPNEVKYVALVNLPVAASGTVPTGSPATASSSNPAVTPATIAVALPTLSIPTSTTQWVASSSFGSPPNFSKPNFSTTLGSTTALVAGRFSNNDTAVFRNVFILAVLKDASGNPIGVSQTELDSIAPNQAEDFSVSYPIVPGIDPTKTEVQVYAARP